jgi:hypothetical protein
MAEVVQLVAGRLLKQLALDDPQAVIERSGEVLENLPAESNGSASSRRGRNATRQKVPIGDLSTTLLAQEYSWRWPLVFFGAKSACRLRFCA